MGTIKLGCVAGVVAMVWAGGCDEDGRVDDVGVFGADDEDDGVVQARTVVINDLRLNDLRLNDLRLNGSVFNATDPNPGVRLNGDAPLTDWIEITDFWLPNGGSSLVGQLQGGMLRIQTGGGWLEEWDVENTIITYSVTEGGSTKTKEVWLKWASELGAYSGVWSYVADLRINGGPWQPLCLDAQGNRQDTLLLGDVWEPSSGNKLPRPANIVTFACRSAALAKCVEFGYKPWASKNGTPLANYHQACTRMVRADYCGDGNSHTLSGTQIHVLDQLAIQKKAVGVTYAVEAEWGPNGATCLNPANRRHSELPVVCEDGHSIPACGATAFSSGGLIQSGKL